MPIDEGNGHGASLALMVVLGLIVLACGALIAMIVATS